MSLNHYTADAMKLLTLITTAVSMTATAFAGGSSKEVISAPAPAPTLGGWFVGGTYGQLEAGHNGEDLLPGYSIDDVDFDIYTLHIGRDLGRQVLGFDTAAYLEVGLMDGETSIENQIGVDVELIPVTANIKLERPIFNQFSVYATAGLGYAFSDIAGNGQSATDGGFIAQASAGVLYNITQQLEAFAGVRYMFLDSVNFGGIASDLELDNEIGWEIGLRYNF
jgi:opacity protein-like surface antigen